MATTLDSKGNEIINGFSTNLSPSQNAISTNMLGTAPTPLPVASVADTTPIYNSAINTGASLTQSGFDLAQKQADELAAQNQYVQGSNTLSALQGQVAGKAADQASIYQNSGINDLYKQLSQLNVEAQGLARESQAAPIQTQQESIGLARTDRGIAPLDAAKRRDIALRSLELGQRAAIAQGNYDVAKNLADQQIAAKYAGIDAQIEAQKTNLAALDKIVLTPAQEKRKEAQAQLLKKQEQEIADKKASDKAINDMLIEASPVAPSDVIARAKDIQAKGGSAVQVAAALGKYGGDYLKNELLKEQIKKTQAETAKTRSEIVKIDNQSSLLKAQPTGVITAPNGDAIGLPNETLSAIGRLKLNEGQANAVAFASRMIQSNQALNKQLGTISPTGGFYETTGYDPTSAGSAIGRFTGSDQSRVYNTNSSDFIRAKLRKESGATISPEEMAADAAIYTPSGAGLDEKDLLLAKTKRDEAIKSMIAQSGAAAPYLQQYYEQSKTQMDNFVSENPQLNAWYKSTTKAVNNATTAATSGATSYGFVDNQNNP